MKIALASPRFPTSIDDGLERVRRLMADAASQGATIICFPEAYLPGLRGLEFDVAAFSAADEARVLDSVGKWAADYEVSTILGHEHVGPDGPQIVASVFDRRGVVIGRQTKNQIDPSEDWYYMPGRSRRLFDVEGLVFGVVICHEGWRYPETVRWAAARGAAVVFHQHYSGGHRQGIVLTEWGAKDAPFYEKAMLLRSLENTIYFASVNYALRYQESATSVIDPSGICQAYLPYGHEGVLVADIDPDRATGLLARRFAPERYTAAD